MMSDLAAPTRSFILDPVRPRFVLQLSVLSFVVVVHSDPRRALVGAGLAIVGLLIGNMIESRWFWWFTSVVMAGWFLIEWPLLDNHVALSVYWAIAVAVALSGDEWAGTLSAAARWTIVTVFTLALFWKAVSPDFISGAFFEWTLLVDPRFGPLAQILGVSGDALEANREFVAAGLEGALQTSNGVGIGARLLTIGTFVVEGSVAVLWALGRRAGNLRHWALVAFGFLTYVIVPVAGFGFMLFVIAAATATSAKGRLGYALGSLALFLYSLLFMAVVL